MTVVVIPSEAMRVAVIPSEVMSVVVIPSEARDLCDRDITLYS